MVDVRRLPAGGSDEVAVTLDELVGGLICLEAQEQPVALPQQGVLRQAGLLEARSPPATFEDDAAATPAGGPAGRQSARAGRPA